MFRRLLMAVAGILLLTPVAQAEEGQGRHRIGYGWLATNDLFGDGYDRWRTGSFTSSRIYGSDWQGALPTGFGELLELRIQGQIIAPADLRRPHPIDRRWAGALSAELYSHFQRGGTEYAVGAGVLMTGPQTRLDSLQSHLHHLFNAPIPSDAVRAAQIPDQFRLVAGAEVGRRISLGGMTSLRPFAEVRAGDEDLVRAGFDVTVGQVTSGEFLVRESISGQRYRTMSGGAAGFSLTLGADLAHVGRSIYLPAASGHAANDWRRRARMGVHWQGEEASAFYGLTYLGPEFVGQPEGQLVGSIRVQLRF